ncbi:putative ribonuclease H-like domain-containing protein [Tanacetum coccineum]|uniref:Ribonuclease H-like domain-containing protein n=1 Tax=Tanacetum coccineum TaxID=301880 RepID=A0ABQ5A3K8_9ASTR
METIVELRRLDYSTNLFCDMGEEDDILSLRWIITGALSLTTGTAAVMNAGVRIRKAKIIILLASPKELMIEECWVVRIDWSFLSEHSFDPESENSSVPPKVHVSTPITTTIKSLSHLIKDCDYYEKKMARKAEVKKQRVFNTGNGVANSMGQMLTGLIHANNVVHSSVLINAGWPFTLAVWHLLFGEIEDRQTTFILGCDMGRLQGRWAIRGIGGERGRGEWGGGEGGASQIYSGSNETDNGGGAGNTSVPVRMSSGPAARQYLSHLIKDCDYYEKKMAREAEVKKQRVFNTGNGVAKPVWTNANRVNHSNKFVPRSVQLNAGRPNINSVRPNINTGRTNVNPVRPRVNTGSSNVNTVRSRQPVPTKTSNSFSPKRPQGNWGSAIKTSAGYNWRNSNSNCDSGPTFIRTDHPLKNMVDRGIFDSGCSGHMTGNKDQLEDFEEFNGGSVTFGGSKGYISGTSEVTNSAGTLQSPNANASKEADEDGELIVMPTAIKHSATNVGPRKSSTNSKEEKFLTELQNLQTQEREAFSTGISEDTPEILAFRRDLDQLAQKHLREVTTDKATSTNLVNSGSGLANTQPADQDDLDMPEITFFNKPQKGIFDEASYDEEEEPKKISEALKDDSWVEAMQEELLQFRLQHVWILVDLPHGAKVIGTKWVYRNKQDKRGVVVRNKARLVAQGHKQEEGIDYDEDFAPRSKDTEGVPLTRLYLLRKNNRITCQDQVYVDAIIFGSTRKSWCDEFEALMKGKFQMSSMGELIFFLGLQVKHKTNGIFISQDKSMIGSLMYLTASRPDIMFAVCVCSRFQVTPKTSHLNAVKRIFKCLKGKPNLGLWYPRESSFDLEAFSDSDYAGANLDRKSTTGGYQFLGSRLISWQCKKQTIVATSTTEAEYVAAASCYGQLLWIQNQMLDYGFNFMNTKIHIDNKSTICIMKNPVYHSKTKHIEIRHHFIRDSYEKKLIRVEKIHTDNNVADLFTKAFDGPRFNFLVVNIGYTWIALEHDKVLKLKVVQKYNSGIVNINTGMDISKITRKQSKMGKHGHGNQKSTKEAK